MLRFKRFTEAKEKSERGKPGWYNDEAALKDLFNKHPEREHLPSVEGMHKMIDKVHQGVLDRRGITGTGSGQPKHGWPKGKAAGPVPYRSRAAFALGPLHVQHADPGNFAHKVLKEAKKEKAPPPRDPFGKDPMSKVAPDVKARAIGTYYSGLKAASKTVAGINAHPDFKGAWKHARFETSGKSSAELSDTAIKHGVTNKTVKGDISVLRSKDPKAPYRGVRTISLKQKISSQGESGGPNRAGAVYDAAFQDMFKEETNLQEAKKSEYTPKDKEYAYTQLASLKKHMKNGHIKAAQGVVKDLDTRFPKLRQHVWFHGMSGKGLFKGEEGTATHVATIGSQKVRRVGDWVKHFSKDYGKPLPLPEVGAGKHRTSKSGKHKANPKDTALRLRIPGLKD